MTKTTALTKEITRETDKAILLRCFSIKSGRHDVWFPKSQIEIGAHFVFVPEWLADAKSDECGKGLGRTNIEIARKIEAEALVAA